MRLASFMVALLCAIPVLILAVALGPVIVGVLCAVGCMLLVAVLVNVVIGLGMFGRSLERTAVRYTRSRR